MFKHPRGLKSMQHIDAPGDVKVIFDVVEYNAGLPATGHVAVLCIKGIAREAICAKNYQLR